MPLWGPRPKSLCLLLTETLAKRREWKETSRRRGKKKARFRFYHFTFLSFLDLFPFFISSFFSLNLSEYSFASAHNCASCRPWSVTCNVFGRFLCRFHRFRFRASASDYRYNFISILPTKLTASKTLVMCDNDLWIHKLMTFDHYTAYIYPSYTTVRRLILQQTESSFTSVNHRWRLF